MFCLISEIGIHSVSVLVICVVPLSSEGPEMWMAKSKKSRQDFRRMGFSWARVQLFVSAKWIDGDARWVEAACVLSAEGGVRISPCLLSSDDRTEEAEAADWPVGTPSAHEHQPPAACMNSAATIRAFRPPCFTSVWLWVWKYLNTVGKRCNIVSCQAMCSSSPRRCCSRE